MVRGDVKAARAPSRKREQGRQMCRCRCHRRRAKFWVGLGPPVPLGSQARSGAASGLWRGGVRHWPHLRTPPVHRPQFPRLLSGSGSGLRELGPPVFMSAVSPGSGR